MELDLAENTVHPNLDCMEVNFMIFILRDYVRDTINAKLDQCYRDFPDAAIDREIHFNQLLRYVDEHGTLPEFTMKRTEKNRPGDTQQNQDAGRTIPVRTE